MATHEIEYQYSDEFIRLVTRQFMWKFGGTGVFLASFLLAGSLIALALGSRGVLVWFCLGLSLTYAIVWFRYFKTCAAIGRTMADRTVRVTLTDEDLTLTTSEHTSTLKWSRIREVWALRDVWLLFPYGTGAGSYSAIPRSAMGPEVSEFLLTRLREAGSRVVKG